MNDFYNFFFAGARDFGKIAGNFLKLKNKKNWKKILRKLETRAAKGCGRFVAGWWSAEPRCPSKTVRRIWWWRCSTWTPRTVWSSTAEASGTKLTRPRWRRFRPRVCRVSPKRWPTTTPSSTSTSSTDTPASSPKSSTTTGHTHPFISSFSYIFLEFFTTETSIGKSFTKLINSLKN